MGPLHPALPLRSAPSASRPHHVSGISDFGDLRLRDFAPRKPGRGQGELAWESQDRHTVETEKGDSV